MSGFYNNWYKVNNPNTSNNIIQMESGGAQPSFFFGGSQVPYNLKIDNSISGGSIKSRKHTLQPIISGKEKQRTTIDKYNNVYIPRKLSSLNRDM